MHTKIYVTLLFLLMSALAPAQKNVVVYHITGNVNIVTGSNTLAAKRGDILAKSNSLQVKNGSSCMIIEEKGRSLQVNTAGTYTFITLQKMMANTGKDGISQKFFSYVYDNLFQKHGEKLSINPVVFRGDELMKLPSDNSIILTPAFTVGWKKPAGNIPVHLVILDAEEAVIIDTVLKSSTSLVIHRYKYNLKEGSIYKWKTEESNTRQPKERYFYFLFPGKNEHKQIENDLRLLQDKNLTHKLKGQMQHDIFLKWKQFYSDRN